MSTVDVLSAMTDDPIAQLVHDLRTHGKPSLAWCVRWSEGGREPVQAAWEASADWAAMKRLKLIAEGGHASWFIDAMGSWPDVMLVSKCGRHRLPASADAHRSLWRWTPPTLTELLAKSGAK